MRRRRAGRACVLVRLCDNSISYKILDISGGTARCRPSEGPSLSEARLESVLETAPDGIMVMDEGFTSADLQQGVRAALFGYDAGEVIGREREYADAARASRAITISMFTAIVPPANARSLGWGERSKVAARTVRSFHLILSVGEALTPNGQAVHRRHPRSHRAPR
jgi:PAS domain-containing protein